MYGHAVIFLTVRRDSSHGVERAARSSFGGRETAMLKSYSYKAAAHWTNHKRGIVEAESIPRTVNFAAPPEFGGEPGLWTPEHFLLAAVSTCYVATLRAVTDASKLALTELRVSVEGMIEKLQGGYRFTRITIRPVVTITRDEDRDRMG